MQSSNLVACMAAIAILSAPDLASGQQVDTLAEVSVKLSRTGLAAGPTGISTTILSGESMRRGRPFVSLDEAVRFVPGVMARDRGDMSLEPRLMIRGAGARANFGVRGVRIMVDGVPATLADGQSPLTSLDLELAQRIEVSRGPIAALHGNGSQGLLSISTPARLAEGVHGNAVTSHGSFGTTNLRLVAGLGSGDAGGMLAVSRLTTDGIREHSAGEQTRARAALELRLRDGSKLIFRGQFSDDPWLDSPGALTAREFMVNPRMASPSNLAKATGKRVRQQQLSTQYQSTSTTSRFEVTVWLLSRNLFNPIGLSPASSTDPLDGTLIEVDRSVAGIRTSATTSLGTALLLRGGIDFQLQDDLRSNAAHHAGTPVAGSTFLDQRQTIAEVGPFLQLVTFIGKGFSLTNGARYDRVTFKIRDRLVGANGGDSEMSALSANSSMAWADNTTNIWFGIGNSFDTPTSTELAGRIDGRTGINDVLDPSRSRTVEAGVRHTHGGLSVELAGWQTTTTQTISAVEQIDGRSYFANIGKTSITGVEAAASIQLNGQWNLHTTATIQRARFGQGSESEDGTPLNGNILPGVPSRSLNLGVTGVLGMLTIDVDQQLNSGVFADDSNLLSVTGWGAGVFGVGLRLETGSQVSLFASATNILDHAYVGSVVVNGFGGRVIEPGPSRTIRFGAEARL